jgi:hypothetical protein
MDSHQQAVNFVEKYSAMFKEDKWFWIIAIESELIKARLDQMREDKNMTMETLKGVSS